MAMPIYRVVYKANMLDESTMFIDPCRRSAKSIVAFKVKTGTGRDFATADQKNSVSFPSPRSFRSDASRPSIQTTCLEFESLAQMGNSVSSSSTRKTKLAH